MVTWAIRILLAAGAVVVLIAALGSRRATEQVVTTATPVPIATVVVVLPPTLTPVPTLRPTITPEPFVERITSRISRETPAPYPTATPPPAGFAFVNVVDFGYMPSVTRIHVGETVVWQNGGRELHDVVGGRDEWHSGPIESMAEYRRVFGFEGTFGYRCSVHPDMRGTIIVTP
jgi:hypothetical protein